MRLTKIIATIGPACNSEEKIRQMIQGGMDIARLNFSHGTHDEHLKALRLIRAVSEKTGRPVAVMQDLCGPKIRVGEMKTDDVELKTDGFIRITKEEIEGDENTISCNYPRIVDDVEKGDRILINDGLIELQAIGKSGGCLECKVMVGGPLKSHKGINLPGVKVSAPTLSEKDRKDLEWGLENNVDYVALSFVRKADDIRELREILQSRGSNIHIIAKIEKPEAIEQIDEIIQAADGIMIARGDLGVEMHVEEVPVLQKRLINLCAHNNKPVIVATQMLESMIENAAPTRAEVSDIANAILDGTDAVMLSGETSVGRYPLRALAMMAHVARRAEESMKTEAPRERRLALGDTQDFSHLIAYSVAHLARRLGVKLILGFTSSGSTVRLLSKRRMTAPIFGASTGADVVRKMCLYRGVVPMLMEKFSDSELMFKKGAALAVENNLAEKGDDVVFVAGLPLGASATNTLRLEKL